MLDDLIKIHRVWEDPIEVPRSRVIWTDRSRIDEQCLRQRYLKYNYLGTGLSTTGRNEDLLIGGAVHEGVDLLLQGGELGKALAVAEECYSEGPPYGDYLLPEQKEILMQDGLHLVKAMIYAFYTCYLPQYQEEYETLEIEEEINWLVRGTTGSSDKVLVCMSRPDAILRHRESGRLWHVSHKTTKRFDDIMLSKLDVDIQRFAEGMAIWAKFGEPPEGTLYNYFIKGDRRRDEATGMDRYVTGLIRPYIQRLASMGTITPEMLAYQYEWERLDKLGGVPTKKRLGKGWEKCDIYKEMDYMTYLEWLREKWVDPGRDFLLECQAGMIPVYWDQDHAHRWVTGIRKTEEDWYNTVQEAKGMPFDYPVMDHHFPLASQQCFSYNHRCAYFNICWRGKTPETLLEEGTLAHREPNHLQEFYEVM
jgi:hypothetical protein